jgi:hypothetical protein
MRLGRRRPHGTTLTERSPPLSWAVVCKSNAATSITLDARGTRSMGERANGSLAWATAYGPCQLLARYR